MIEIIAMGAGIIFLVFGIVVANMNHETINKFL